jgi:hypothetical protein
MTEINFQEAMERRLQDLADWDFEELLEPYREGGSAEKPVRRTWGTLISWLHGKYRFEFETIGAAILLVALELKNGRQFEGDGTYGSPGDQLAKYIHAVCATLKQKQMADQVFTLMGRKLYQQVEGDLLKKMRAMTRPWYARIFHRGSA